MPSILINASNWNIHRSVDGKIAIYSPGSLTTVCSLEKALDPIPWSKTQGAFASLFVDEHNDELVLVRDHFGCASFYYYDDGHYFIFGSNLPDLIKHLPVSPQFNTTQLIALFTWTQSYSDDTFYQKIQRVEPGHIIHISRNRRVRKIPFWKLDPETDSLNYTKDEDYLEQFTELIEEAVLFNTQNTTSLSGELSGGLDSSAILLAANQQAIRYPLFMHVANPSGSEVDDRHLAEILLKHIGHQDAHFITAEQFDFIKTLEFCAKQFAGAAPYIFFMMAQNIHQAVVNRGCTVLLSGAGGDQCVSSHASLSNHLSYFIRQGNYREAWRELCIEYHSKNTITLSFIKRAEMILKHANPFAYRLLTRMETMSVSLRHYFQNMPRPNVRTKPFYQSLREQEWDVLQGPNSHEVRMRIEYSAVLAKAMGFEYRYPLLYPKLVDFCFRLPWVYKRRNGVGRYMIRQYLQNHAPREVYSKQQKQGGIIPATLEQTRRYWLEGLYDSEFNQLPFLEWSRQNTTHQAFVARIHAYMFKVTSLGFE